jgi:hypothetical protein
VKYFVVTNSVITRVHNVKQQDDSHAQQISFWDKEKKQVGTLAFMQNQHPNVEISYIKNYKRGKSV